MTVLAVNQHSIGYRELGWLILALVLHALLLLVPVEQLPTGSLGESTRLVLRPVSERPTSAPPTPAQIRPTTPVSTPKANPSPLTPATDINEVTPEPAPAEPTDTEQSAVAVSAAGLVSVRDTVTKRVPLAAQNPAAQLRLGAPRPFTRPENWQPGAGAEALAPFENVFNGKTVPVDLDVVDRWLAADGSQNVVVETPNGLRLCGRANAWDPARPLVEHVMRWQVCGGDYARPFKFRPRGRLDRDFIIPVAKDATTP